MNRWLLLVVALLVAGLALAACGGGDDEEDAAAEAAAAAETAAAATEAAAPQGDAAHGQEIFSMTCFACHGEGGVGVEGLGKNMPESEFIKGLSDTELVEFIKVGRDPSHPDNTTGVAMPPKGGNPALSDQDLYDVVAYIRTLTGQAQ